MMDVNGFPRKNPAVILNSICMVRNVRLVTVIKYVVIFIFIYEWQSVRVCQNPNNAG